MIETPAYVEINMKIKCKRCDKELPADDFIPREDSKTGYRRECRACMAEAGRLRRKRRREKKEDSIREKVDTQKWNTRHRKKLLAAAGSRISNGDLIAETARSMTFNLSLIVEQQLRLFYGRHVSSVLGKSKMSDILDDTLFELKQALGRTGIRMKSVRRNGEAKVDLHAPVRSMEEKMAARTLLGVSEKASRADIKAAYRYKAFEAHPDRNGTTEAMAALNRAFDLLVEDANG